MSLNLMLTSSNAVYLTGDFRLTRICTQEFIDNRDVQKMIPVIRSGWGALIGYAGIVSAPPAVRDTGHWVAEQMDKIEMNGSLDELPKQLLTANDWLRKVRGETALAFSIVGYVKRRPFMMLISNFLDLEGNITKPRSNLEVYQSKPKKVEIRVIGVMNAVQPEEKEHLKLLLNRNADPQSIREYLAEVNAKAAERSKLISPECITGFLLPSGAAEIGPHRIGESEPYLPDFVKRDLMKHGIVGYEYKYDEDGNSLLPRWVGMTARIQKVQGRKVVAVIHALRNVGKPIGDGIERKGEALFWKIAGPDEPRSFTFSVSFPPTKK